MSFTVGDIVRMRESDALYGVSGVVEEVGRRQCRVRFVRFPWTPPEVTLPEQDMVPHNRLIKCRDPWSEMATGKPSSAEALSLRIQAARLWLANSNGQLGNARTDLLPHQVCLVHEVVEASPRRFIIAEEVGMGKTIETGMIMHALEQRRELERCLIICPAGQIRQWQDELESKLRLRFEIYREDVDGQRAFSYPRVIASLDTVKLDQENKRLRNRSHRDILLDAANWDLVVFDEAHRLSAKDYGNKKEKTLNYRLAEELCQRTRDFLFLTGTPHDGNDSKFRNLLKALYPSVVFSPSESGRFFGDMILKNRKAEAIGADGKHLFRKVQVSSVSLLPDARGEAEFHAQLTQYLIEGYGIADMDPQNPKNRALGFVMTTFQKLATSSIAAVRKSLRKRLKLLEGKLEEAKASESTDENDERFAGESEEQKADSEQLKHLREAFSEHEIGILKNLTSLPVEREAKVQELMRLVNEFTKHSNDDKLIIFTEYRGTVAFLKESLEQSFGSESVETIMGGDECSGSDGTHRAIQNREAMSFPDFD